MKEKKRRIELLSFYNHTGIERHLSHMARKGWLIEKMSNYFWTYRRITPTELHFTVCYFPKASDFDPGPSEAQQTLIDYCAKTGWELVCTWFQMQVFCNAEKDPVPVNTEPELEVEVIHKACRANYLRGYKILLAVSAVFTLLFASSLFGDTLRILSSPTDFTAGMCVLILFLLSLAELTAYYSWHRKAKRAAAQGLFLDTPSTSGIQRILLTVLLLSIAYWIVSLLLGSDPLMAWISLAVLFVMAASAFLVNGTKTALKKLKVSSGMNRVLTAASGFLFTFVLMGAVVGAGLRLSAVMNRESPVGDAGIPLRIEDLRETGDSGYITTSAGGGSLFLSRLEIHQRPGFEEEAPEGIPELGYERYIVRVPVIYDFCRSQMKRLTVWDVYGNGTLVPQDAAPWDADEAYRLVLDDGTETNVYLLCYKDLLVRLELSWKPDQAQMETAGKAFRAE